MSFTKNGISVSPPPGAVAPYYGTTDPSGWIICDGQPRTRNLQNDIYSNLVTMNVGTWTTTTYTPPDLRGLFIRGAGTNGTTDYTSYAGSSVGQFQKDMVKKHTHGYAYFDINLTTNTKNINSYSGPGLAAYSYSVQTITNTSNKNKENSETRPANVSYNWIIKL